MASNKGYRKKSLEERRRIVERYEAWRRNMPKVICADNGIHQVTLRAWVRELRSGG